jgi:hypothetical protein
MNGSLITCPILAQQHIPVMQNLKSFIQTWFPEIPREDMQQILDEHHNHHIACIESRESYGTG